MLGDKGATGIGDAKDIVAAELEGCAVPSFHQPAPGQCHASRMIVTARAGDDVGAVLRAAAELIDAQRVLQDLKLDDAARPAEMAAPVQLRCKVSFVLSAFPARSGFARTINGANPCRPLPSEGRGRDGLSATDKIVTSGHAAIRSG
jgi:hypothetical protein